MLSANAVEEFMTMGAVEQLPAVGSSSSQRTHGIQISLDVARSIGFITWPWLILAG